MEAEIPSQCVYGMGATGWLFVQETMGSNTVFPWNRRVTREDGESWDHEQPLERPGKIAPGLLMEHKEQERHLGEREG